MTVTLKLERKLDFRAVSPLAAALLAAKGQDIALDAADTVQIGTQSLQVILAAAKTADSAGKSLRLLNLADTATDQLALLGFQVADVEAGGDAVARGWQ